VAEKTVSSAQLKRLAKEGAEIKFAPKAMEIEQFGELIEALKTMTANEAERIRADVARNQTNLEVIAALQALIKKPAAGVNVPPPDLQPIRDLIEEMRLERHHEPVDYDFKILRSGPGLSPAVKIEARAVKPTLN
jgi:hypothetical protein